MFLNSQGSFCLGANLRKSYLYKMQQGLGDESGSACNIAMYLIHAIGWGLAGLINKLVLLVWDQ